MNPFYLVLKIPLSLSVGQMIAAFLGGLAPVLLWLWFLEHEDKHPEPKWLIVAAFVGGMATVFVALEAEWSVTLAALSTPITILIWAAIEEIGKYIAAYLTALRNRENDEPIDNMMYMVATALGFAGVENVFYILNPIRLGLPIQAVITGNFRFLGATLLHVVASSIIGACLALSFYKSKTAKVIYLTIGIVLAIALHTAFNLSIMIIGGDKAVFAFYAIWAALICILLFFEKAKRIKNN